MYENYEFTEDHIVMSSSPTRRLSEDALKTLIIADTQKSSERLADYFGFTNYVTIQDYVAKRPYLFPFDDTVITKDKDVYNTMEEDIDDPIKQIVLYVLPYEWNIVLQVLLDLLSSDGNIKNRVKKQVVDFFVTNADFTFISQCIHPQFTTGAFVEVFKVLFQETHSFEPNVTLLGKPSGKTFACCNQKLLNISPDIETVYMIGDNLVNDAAGANEFSHHGNQWKSVLVKTGIYKEGDDTRKFEIECIGENVVEVVKKLCEKHTIQLSI